MLIKDLSFDFDDKNLFIVDDIKLKADAIKNSILPKLELINNQTIATIAEVYKINPLELSTILKFPAFRKNRTTDFSIDYNSSEAGLGGKRDNKLWTNVRAKTNKHPYIIPFSLTYELDYDGLKFYFLTNRYNITLKDNDAFYEFQITYENEINALANQAVTTHLKFFSEGKEKNINPFSPTKDYLKWQQQDGFYDTRYDSEIIKYPITSDEITTLIKRFVTFFPIYYNHIQISCGREIKIKEQISSLIDWLVKLMDESDANDKNVDINTKRESILSDSDARKAAETKIRVMPAMRWQVFQRDNWRCLSCGRTSDDGIILHVDHIIPRSKGGLDHMDNYQTLCDICNIGKSNRDQTDLRSRYQE